MHVRRQLRRQLFSHRAYCCRLFLARAFGAWRRAGRMPTLPLPDGHFARLYQGFLGLQVRAVSRLIALHSKADAAQAARDTLNSARKRGPEELYRIIRQTMRQGRRYKPPALKPCLSQQARGEGDSTLELGMHFAKKLFSLVSGPFGWSSGLRNRGTFMRREETKSIRFVGPRHSKSLRLKTKNWKTNIVCTAQDAQMHHLLTARNENLKTL